ncbi:MAG TPA: GtrA family protein [Solirubrobacteraceae bacterium]
MTRSLRVPGGRGQRVLTAAGSLRSPGSGLLGQGARFILAGGIVVVIYVTTTTVLADVVGIHFEIALAIGFAVGLMVQFQLYRLFVWIHHEEFALPVHHQAGLFLAAAAVNYGLTAASTSLLPAALGISTEIVYLATVATLPVINFLVLRRRIFHPKPAGENTAPVPISKGA